MALKAILLDIDGTLLDSNDAHAAAWCEVLSRHGFAVSREAVRAAIGMGGDKLLPRVAGIREDSELGRRISQERRRFFTEKLLPRLSPTAGARPLIERFVAEGLQRVVATSAGSEEVHGLLRQAGVEDLIDLTTTADDAASSKPDPDIVLAALRKVGVGADEVMLLGDTPYDMEAAKAAGVRAVALRCGGTWSDSALSMAEAIYDDPRDLLHRYGTSPFRQAT